MTVFEFHSSIAVWMDFNPSSLKPGSITYGMAPSGQRYLSSTGELSRLTGPEPVTSLMERLFLCCATISSTVLSTMSPSWMAIPLMTS